MRKQFPGSPIMYRPVTYLYKKGLPSGNYFLKGATTPDIDYINESVYRVGQSVRYMVEQQQEPDRMPIFRWGDKLVGNNQYGERVNLKCPLSAFAYRVLIGARTSFLLARLRGPNALRCGIVSAMAVRGDVALLP